MRIAILADIHGNLIAFETALAHVAAMGVDQIVIAGDVVNGGPDSLACWDLAASLGVPMLRGNHERYVGHFGMADAPAEWNDERFAPVRWAVEQLGERHRASIRALPMALRIPGADGMLVVHASPRSDADSVFAHTPDSELSEMFVDAEEPFIVRGHQHIGAVRLWGDRTIVTAGSVGLALGGYPAAQYVICAQSTDGWKFAHQSVPYDIDAAVARFRDTGYLADVGPMGRLFLREVVTAGVHVAPFLRHFNQWTATAPISFADAVDKFLNAF